MISGIKLSNFRSYSDSAFEFNSGVNIIVGPNASGKTNIVEAILLAISGRSYRGRDNKLIKHNAEWSRVDLLTDNSQRVIKIKNKDGKIDKIIELEGQIKKRMPKGAIIHSVLFEPNDLLLFHGSPELRREFVDELIGKLDNGFDTIKNRYKRTLQQRNSLLRSENLKKDQMFIWNIKLSELAGILAKYRQELIDDINKNLAEVYSNLSGEDVGVEVIYDTKINKDHYASSMMSLLDANFEQDVIRKHTTIGPHRDDILFFMNDYEIKDVASRGEVRTMILSLKIYESERLYSAYDVRPLILLDDVFSELDGARRQLLTSYLKDNQVFITTTDADVVVQHFSDKSNVIAIG